MEKSTIYRLNLRGISPQGLSEGFRKFVTDYPDEEYSAELFDALDRLQAQLPTVTGIVELGVIVGGEGTLVPLDSDLFLYRTHKDPRVYNGVEDAFEEYILGVVVDHALLTTVES